MWISPDNQKPISVLALASPEASVASLPASFALRVKGLPAAARADHAEGMVGTRNGLSWLCQVEQGTDATYSL